MGSVRGSKLDSLSNTCTPRTYSLRLPPCPASVSSTMKRRKRLSRSTWRNVALPITRSSSAVIFSDETCCEVCSAVATSAIVRQMLFEIRERHYDLGVLGAQNSVTYFAHAVLRVNKSAPVHRIDHPHPRNAEIEVIVNALLHLCHPVRRREHLDAQERGLVDDAAIFRWRADHADIG